ncbi:methyltransferase [Actinoplanes sp. SE50]|uniref:class I SAM-dependent methyltransferase n=1 Tax=unclassified Actinoplanes TaxID=2626549 RepID=UPI00023EC83A|nr:MULTISPECIES: class I SAM-dependent methyltransferase [unclassified Actinoplanes]AEV86466.1 methyltransferase, putative [Actinoplanes sp. SE50/110]ATO84864.1 methyltransferase [Actinoplanes sp. SE50]SLM02273.1 methyltransferase [Actinoplanes sp. SE50/110]
MTRTQGDALPPEASYSLDHFIGLYEAKGDPWDNATKWSDQRKYAVAMASLPQPRYRRCYEPGCAVGVLSVMLAARCDEVVAVDCVDEAVVQARALTAGLPNVRVERALLPAELPGGTFDLIVVGDLLYYLSAADLQTMLDGMVERLEEGGDLVSAHFRDRLNPGNYDGFNVHEAIAARPGLARVIHHEDEWFVLDVFRKVAG